MRLRIGTAMLLVAGGLALSPAASAAEAAVCTWGGTVLEPTGTVTSERPFSSRPSPEPFRFTVTGELDGVHARCTGSMVLEGWFLPGTSCLSGISYAEVLGVPGVAWDVGYGVNGYVHGVLTDADGDVVGSYDGQVYSTGLRATEECRAGTLTELTHASVVELLPTDG